MAAGDFTPSQLVQIKAKAEQMWSGGQWSKDLTPNAEAARVVLANQTARIIPLEDKDRDVPGVKIVWLNTCDIIDEACAPVCDLDEPELESKGKDYNLTLCRHAGFSIDREKIRTDMFTREEQAAQGLAKVLKVLDERIAVSVLTKLKSFAGINLSPAPGTWDNANTTTSIPAAAYNHTLAAYLLQMGIMNKMENNYKLSNAELYIDATNAGFEQGNLDGKGRAAMIESLNLNFDLFNFAKAGLTEDMFVIAKNAVALASKTRYTSTPVTIGSKVGQTFYSVASPSLPGIAYDVTYEVACKVSGGKKRIVDQWGVDANYDVFLNPEGCPVTVDIGGTPTVFNPTGVFSLTKGA